MMRVFHYRFKTLKNPILKVGLNRIFLNVFPCTKCPILQNGLHVDDFFLILI
jgi:hypothetical protein